MKVQETKPEVKRNKLQFILNMEKVDSKKKAAYYNDVIEEKSSSDNVLTINFHENE